MEMPTCLAEPVRDERVGDCWRGSPYEQRPLQGKRELFDQAARVHGGGRGVRPGRAAAGQRLGRPTGTFKAKAVRQEARPALSWVWLPGTFLAAFALTWAQASLVRRRYDNLPPGVSEVDVIVEPAGGCSDVLPVELAAFGDSAVAGVGVEQVKDSLPVRRIQAVNATGAVRSVRSAS